MTNRIITSLFCVLLFVSAAMAQKIEAPKLTPTPSTDAQRRVIDEGVALHDRGDYDGAIAKYEEVLRESPDNDVALYELGFSLQMKKDYKKSLEIGYKGAQYKSKKRTDFYVLIGNNLDLKGEPKKAIEVYRQGIKLTPENQLLYFNLAITYARMNNFEDAKKNLKTAAFLNPNHPSSHFVLAQIFQGTRYKTPALFAVMRFLVLEPRSQRSPAAYKIFSDILSGGVTEGKNPNEINIFVDMNAKKDEGDFGAMELILGLGKAARATEEKKNKTEAELLVSQLDTFLAIISETDPKGDKSKFTWQYYVPYFIELKKRNYVEPFAYYISQSSKMNGVAEWLKANEARVNEFVSWSRGYQWAKQ